MSSVAAAPVTLLPARRTLRDPWHGINPRPVRHLQTGMHWLGNLASLLALVSFFGLAIGPHVLGYRTETMLTASMAPQIKVGDVTVVTAVPVAQVVPGDVISYAIPIDDHRVVSHRVVSVTPNADGSYTLQTKGDANAANDPWTARIVAPQVWQVRAVVPKIGYAIRTLREPQVSQALRVIAPVFFVLVILTSIWRRPKRQR